MANSDISGQITDGSGNAIPNAEVYLWREDLAGAGGVVASTTADSSGNFAFTAHPDGSGSSESWHVAAEDPNANVQLQSAYGVTASPPTSVNSQFDVSITGTDSPVTPGNTLTVDASLTNSGADSDTQTITLDIDNGVGQVDSALEAAKSGASKSTTLSWAVPSGQSEQDYQATVASADDTASQTVTVSGAPPSLVSRWTFDDADTNGTTAVDVVGSNDGEISGDVTTGDTGASQTYPTAEAYDFDGSSGRVTAPTPTVSVGNDFSIAMWVYPRTEGSGTAVNAASAYNNSGDRMAMGFFSDEVVTSVYDGSFTTQSDSFSAFGQWHHLVMTYDASTVSVSGYLNASSFTGSTNQGVGPDGSSFDIGFRGNGNHFDGRIDDVRVYDKPLSSTEVSNLYNNGRI